MSKAIIIVLDSLGVGELPDAKYYGDEGSNTLRNISLKVGGIKLPNLQKMGIGNLTEILGVEPVVETVGAFGKMAESSKGKDTTTGHWELMGIISEEPMPTFPNGFPKSFIENFERQINRKTLGNVVASGTEIIEKLGQIHIETGCPIVYTSADSVFQIAAHEDIIPLEELYRMCSLARDLLIGPLRVGRVIARPFIGKPGSFMRTANRHDYSLKPPEETVLDIMKETGLQTISIGKIYDIFAEEGITSHYSTVDNMDGIDKIKIAYKNELKHGLIFANLVDFDSKYGHRNDPQGYAKALEEFDARLPEIINMIDDETLIFIVADHGCDPTTISTDHSREYVPVLIYGSRIKSGTDLGIRESFADVGATLIEYFTLKEIRNGKSMLKYIL